MPRESPKTFGFVCHEHAPKPGKFTGKSPTDFVGRTVKLGFPAEAPDGSHTHEHMWVRVTGTALIDIHKDQDLIGVLSNDPVLKCDYTCGDEVAFKVDEIEAIYSEN